MRSCAPKCEFLRAEVCVLAASAHTGTVIDLDLGLALRDAGLAWTPAAGDRFVVLERDREAVRRGPGQSGACHQAGQGGRSGLQCCERERGLVEYADARSVVHIPIFSSQRVGCKM